MQTRTFDHTRLNHYVITKTKANNEVAAVREKMKLTKDCKIVKLKLARRQKENNVGS